MLPTRPERYRVGWPEIGHGSGLTARWPGVYDGRNNRLGFTRCCPGHVGLQVKLRPDRAVLDYDWQHSINPK
ncbi:MAG: hypothetical protein IPN42_05685 [Methylococcaceae bacterium]|nr:hypothetical protein [Methylococcaceae bacterium]